MCDVLGSHVWVPSLNHLTTCPGHVTGHLQRWAKQKDIWIRLALRSFSIELFSSAHDERGFIGWHEAWAELTTGLSSYVLLMSFRCQPCKTKGFPFDRQLAMCLPTYKCCHTAYLADSHLLSALDNATGVEGVGVECGHGRPSVTCRAQVWAVITALFSWFGQLFFRYPYATTHGSIHSIMIYMHELHCSTESLY